MLILKDYFNDTEGIDFVIVPGIAASEITTGASTAWNTPSPSIHYDPLPPSDPRPIAITTDET